MLDFNYLFDSTHLILLIPVAFLVLFTLLFQTIESSYFFVNMSRSLYPLVLAFTAYLVVGDIAFPPQDFFQAIIIIFVSLTILFFFGKLLRFLFQILVLNLMIYYVFKDQISHNLIFVVSVGAGLSVLFALLYGFSIGRRPIILKLIHTLMLLGIVHWAFYLNQDIVGKIAILCALSISFVTLLKLVFRKKVVPNFSRPIIDIGIPLVLLWVLLNASGLIIEYLSPYIDVKTYLTLESSPEKANAAGEHLLASLSGEQERS